MTRPSQMALSYIERIYTADAIIPRSADDPDCENGFRCIPIPPTTADDDWTVFDSSKKRSTGWMRVVYLDR